MSKGYNEMKNYLHNELGINREYVLSVAKAYIEESVDKHVIDILNSNAVTRMIDNKIAKALTGQDNRYYRHYDHYGDDKIVDFVKDQITKEVKAEVIRRIDFDSINISIKK